MRCLSFRRIVAHWMGIAMTVPILGAQTLGAFDSQADVGSTRHPGTTSYYSQRQEYVIAGSGQNMWNDRDDFHFVWKRMAGNFILSTRAHFIGNMHLGQISVINRLDDSSVARCEQSARDRSAAWRWARVAAIPPRRRRNDRGEQVGR